MTVLIYHKRFIAPIKAGIKRQTIRPERKRPIKVGDELSHRIWEGKAYRSPQKELASGRCIGVFPISVYSAVIQIGTPTGEGTIDQLIELDKFARSDGFDCWKAMIEYFDTPPGYGLPFNGVLIQWE